MAGVVSSEQICNQSSVAFLLILGWELSPIARPGMQCWCFPVEVVHLSGLRGGWAPSVTSHRFKKRKCTSSLSQLLFTLTLLKPLRSRDRKHMSSVIGECWFCERGGISLLCISCWFTSWFVEDHYSRFSSCPRRAAFKHSFPSVTLSIWALAFRRGANSERLKVFKTFFFIISAIPLSPK